MRILLYLTMLLIGIFIGYKEITHQKLLQGLDKFQMAALVLLLFIMGVRIGADEQVMDAIDIIGLKGLIFAVISIFFSVLFVFIYIRLTNRGGQKE